MNAPPHTPATEGKDLIEIIVSCGAGVRSRSMTRIEQIGEAGDYPAEQGEGM